MRLKTVAALAVLFMTVGAGVGQAGAIAIEKGNGETTTVNDPVVTNGAGPNAEGVNPAHGPSCGFFEGACARHEDHPGDGVFNSGLNEGINLGAWNSVFQSNENSAICGIWATTAEAVAAGEPGAPTCESP